MRKILFALLLICSNAFGAITDLKLSTAQIFDVQWYISGGTLNASGFNYIYASINYATQTASAARWTAAQTTDAGANGRYIGFFSSTTNPGTYGMAVFNSDGSVYKIINNTGSFRALANGAIFYNGNGQWGTLITTGQGYNYGQSGSWAVTQDNPTNSQLAAYVPPSSTPLAAGQTAAPAQPSGPTVTGGTITQTNAPSNQTIQSGGTYVNNSSRAAQQTRINSWASSAAPYSNSVYVDQIGGDNNNVTISLTGTKNRVELTLDGAGNNTLNLTQIGSNYIKADVNGYQNSLTSNQTNTVGSNYAETTISGNNNTVNHTQSNNNNRLLFSTVNGNNNTLSTTQSGAGQHYLDVRMNGNGHNVLVNQYGASANNAQIDVTNAGGAATVDLEQGGGKSFTLIQSCAISSGCNTTVKQQ